MMVLYDIFMLTICAYFLLWLHHIIYSTLGLACIYCICFIYCRAVGCGKRVLVVGDSTMGDLVDLYGIA